MALTFAVIPAWALPTAPHATALFEVAALAGIEGQWVRLDAATQRALMGFAVFGKQSIRVNADGTVTVSRSTCFGMDSEQHDYPPALINAATTARKRLSPGVFGPGYL